jgi:hypothetical protein
MGHALKQRISVCVHLSLQYTLKLEGAWTLWWKRSDLQAHQWKVVIRH